MAMRPSATPRPTPSPSPWRVNLGKSARRDVRRADALARSLNLRSFTLHGVVWTLPYDLGQRSLSQPCPSNGTSGRQPSARAVQSAPPSQELTSRQLKRQERFRAFRAVQQRWARFSALHLLLRTWRAWQRSRRRVIPGRLPPGLPPPSQPPPQPSQPPARQLPPRSPLGNTEVVCVQVKRAKQEVVIGDSIVDSDMKETEVPSSSSASPGGDISPERWEAMVLDAGDRLNLSVQEERMVSMAMSRTTVSHHSPRGPRRVKERGKGRLVALDQHAHFDLRRGGGRGKDAQ